MAKYYAPNFSGLLPLFDGKSAAGGKLYAYRAGSSIPAPLFDEDGVELGSWVSIDSNGCADFLLDSALSYKLIVKDALGAVVGEWDNVKATNAEGMENPMTAPGDLIVGGTGGTATALPVGTAGQVLTSDGTTASWAAPAAQQGDHLVKASATDASDPGSLNDKIAVLSPVTKNTIITPQGDEKLLLGISTSGVTDGYVLTKGMTGADWAAIPTQPGDHKTAVDGADASPDYLAAKLAAGSGISLTNTGSAVEIAATAQTGDHQLLVSATDAAAGYLGAKLTAGSNVTLTPQTDGDGVQTLEISATGGGSALGSYHLQYPDHKTYANANFIHFVKVPGIILPEKIGSWSFWPRESPTTLAAFRCWCALFEERDNSQNINISSFTYPVTPPTPNRTGDTVTFNFDALVTIDKTKMYRVGIWFGGSGISSVFVNAPQTAQDSGNWTWFGAGYASATPPANTSGISASSINEVPWFSLNERTI